MCWMSGSRTRLNLGSRGEVPLDDGAPRLGRHPRRVALECRKALLQALAPPIAGWPLPFAGESGPFALPALPGFIARTARPSLRPASVLCSSWVCHLEVSLGIKAQCSHVPHKSLCAGLSPSPCRSPLGQSAGTPRALSQANDRSLVSTTSVRFRHVINGSLAFDLPADT